MLVCMFFFKQKTAYEMRISDWSSDVCSSDLGRLQAAAQVGLDGAVERPALGMPEHRARRLLLQMEEVHLAAEAPVVALFSLLQHGEVGLELLLVLPAGAVDALELRGARSEERRVGKGGVSTGESRGGP